MSDNLTLATDLYELTMGNTYFLEGDFNEQVYFDIFFRRNPFGGEYTISCGLYEIINYIRNFRFDDEDIEYLRSLGAFPDEFLSYLKGLKFKGDLFAVPDGTAIFPNEPIITVKTDIIVAQILETALLSYFNHGSLVATSAKRITHEAGEASVSEFGLRRGPGIIGGTEASRAAFIGGCCSTSNTYAGKLYGIPVSGTQAHSSIQKEKTEEIAFLKHAKANPNNCLFLVDTYNVLKSGMVNAIKVANEYLKPNGITFRGVRIDSGDLAYLSIRARKMLDDAGYKEAKICLSNGLDEFAVRELKRRGAKFDLIGAGDCILSPNDRVGGVYKLAAVEEDGLIIPKIKISGTPDKTTIPGYKTVYRIYNGDGIALGDVVALYDEIIGEDDYPLVHPLELNGRKLGTDYYVRKMQEPIFLNGELVYDIPSIFDSQAYCEREHKSLPNEVTDIIKPKKYPVVLSNQLGQLKKNMVGEYLGNIDGHGQYVK